VGCLTVAPALLDASWYGRLPAFIPTAARGSNASVQEKCASVIEHDSDITFHAYF